MRAMAEDKRPRVGPYELRAHIGEGGMCHVFRARKDGETTDCALKLLKEDQRKDERILDLFVTEADLAMLFDHPNLITTLDAGEHRDRYYIAMELIEGANLKQIHEQCDHLGVRLPPDFALFFVNEILEGIGALHDATAETGRELGLVHRDVTPSNVFISFDGRVVVGDFGIAHIKAYGQTEPGQAVGKLGYLAPEIVTEEGIDRRSDLFAVGIILYELLTHTRLYSGADEEAVLNAIASADVVRPRKVMPGLAKGVEQCLMKALTRRPKDRFQTAAEMATALRPHWSEVIADTDATSALMNGIYREEARKWRDTKTDTTQIDAEP